MTLAKTIPAQVEIPVLEVYRNDDGAIVVWQGASAGDYPQALVFDEARAVLLAMALIDTVKGE